MTNLQYRKSVEKVLDLGKSTKMPVNMVGKMTTKVLADGRNNSVCVENLTFFLDLKTKLVSVSRLREKDI